MTITGEGEDREREDVVLCSQVHCIVEGL